VPAAAGETVTRTAIRVVGSAVLSSSRTYLPRAG
jgi:hypothetical protein